jgi:hypothetical protein
MMRLSALLAVAALVAVSLFPLPEAAAQEVKLDVHGGDTVKSVLERLVGKRVSLVLTAGPEVAGVVTTVGDKVVLLKDLTNREFFDGVVSLDRVTAVIVRTRSR